MTKTSGSLAASEGSSSPDRKRPRGRPVLTWLGGIATGLIVSFLWMLIEDGIEASRQTDVPSAAATECKITPREDREGQPSLDVGLSLAGENCWRSGLEGITPGDEFDVLVAWQNFASEQVDDVTIRPLLAAGLEPVPGTAVYGNSKVPDGAKVQGDLFGTGINVGSYKYGANVWIIFTARMPVDFELPCDLSLVPVAADLPTVPAEERVVASAALVTNRTC